MTRSNTGLTLLRLSGWKARVMNVVVGTPLLGVGGVLILVAAFSATGPGRVILLLFGAIPAFAGAVLYSRAVRGTDFTLRLSSRNRPGSAE